MVAIVFPGQGSQAKGMGKELFSEFPDLVRNANDILGYSVVDLCLDNPDEKLNRTEFTQPALYIVSAFSYFKKLNDNQDKPAYVAGHSLGEYNALLAAEVFDFETGLKLVQKRGELMSQASGGGMAAVIGLKSDAIENILHENNLSEIKIANYNSFTQSVLSGPKEVIARAEEIFKNAGAKLFIPLKLSGAFHSPFMNDAQKQFTNFLANFTFTSPKIPVISNVYAKPYQENEIANTLAQQITSSVLWTQSIEYLISQGETTFEEIGPGKVLSGLIARIQKGQ